MIHSWESWEAKNCTVVSEIRDYKITKLPEEYLKGCEMINMGYFEKIWKMLKASKPFSFFCASANIYLTEPVYKLINSRIAKEGEKKKYGCKGI